MDTSLLLTIILGLVVLFYLVATFLSIKTWQVLHVLLVLAVFIASGVFTVFAAATLKTHQQWRSRYNELKDNLEKELALNKEIEKGVLQEIGFSEESLRGAEGALKRTLTDRGRIWRNVTPTGFDATAGTVTVSTVGWNNDLCAALGGAPVAEPAPAAAEPGAEEAEGEAPAPTGRPHGIAGNSVLYVFKEAPITFLNDTQKQALFPESDLPVRDTQGLCKVPGFYLGEFNVTEVGPGTLTLRPTLPLDAAQVAQLKLRDSTWVLYELMPIDAHDVFAGLDQVALGALIPQAQSGLTPAQYTILLSQYLRDQTAAQADDPPERVWMKVKFLKDHKVDVDVAGNAVQGDRTFDPSGRALSPVLQQGAETEFAAGDVALLDGVTAARLIGEGICEKVEQVFVRELRDYEAYFHAFTDRFVELADQIAVVQLDYGTVISSHKKATEQVQYRTQERDQLKTDLQGFQTEGNLVNNYLALLLKQKETLRGQLLDAYRTNNRLAAELATRQREVIQQARRGDEQASASGLPEPVTQ